MDLAAHLSAELLERVAAIAVVRDLGDAASGGGGRAAIIESGAGLGKTAFLDACAKELAGARFRVLGARGSGLERDFPYAIVRQLLVPLRRDARLRAATLSGAGAPAEVLLTEARGTDGAETEPLQIVNALYWAVSNLCDEAPLALLVDDAHEADDASARFLTYLARRSSDLPLLLLVAGRPSSDAGSESLTQRLLEVPDTATITLAALSDAAVERLLAARFGYVPSGDVVAACRSSTGGNPFYLQELIRELAARELPVTVESVGELGPESIARRLRSRFARLPAAARPLARACAVLGEGARLPLCARLADVPLDDAAGAADALVRDGVLAPGRYLAFLHPILQAAVLADLGDHSARRWHARAARVLEEAGFPAELIALHLMRAEPAGDAHVRETLIAAGRTALREGSPSAAAQYLARALDEDASVPDADLRYELGRAQASVGAQAGLVHMAAGVDGTADPHERALRAVRLANFQMRSGDLVQAVEMLTQVRRGVEMDDELLLTVDATRYWAARLHPATRESAGSLAADLRVRADGRDTPAARTALAYLACEAAQTGSAAEASALFDRALAPPGLVRSVGVDAVATQASMLSLLSLERLAQFDALADEVLRDAGRRASVLAFLVASTFRAMLFWQRGELAAAETESREALRAAREHGWQHGAVALFATAALAQLDSGHIAAATRTLDDAERIGAPPPGFPTALLLFARGRLAAVRGAAEDAVADLRSCGATLAEMGIHSPAVLPWRSAAARVLAKLADTEAASALVASELELARRLAGSMALGRALHAQAEVGADPDRVAVMQAAHGALAGSPARLALAAVSVDLGVALRQDRQPTRARETLIAGLELASRCGAAPLVARAREELAVLGVPARRHYAFGPDALTPSESRVARLAASGLSNLEIAQQLFVTRKTVEKHLANAYRKLSIQSRSELAGAGID